MPPIIPVLAPTPALDMWKKKKNPSDVNEEPQGLSNLHFFDYSLATVNSAISTLVSCLSFICTGTVCIVPTRDLMLSIRMRLL